MSGKQKGPDWSGICAACADGTLPDRCAYYGEPNGCNAPTLGKHPDGNAAERFQEALEKSEKNVERLRSSLRRISDELWEMIDPGCHEDCCSTKRAIAKLADDALADTEGDTK